MGISLHIPKSVAPVVWKVVSQENIISIIIIIISCSDHSITYNQFDLKLMKRSLCLSSRLMDHRTTEGELLVNKEHQKKTDVPVILKTRKNAVSSWLQ